MGRGGDESGLIYLYGASPGRVRGDGGAGNLLTDGGIPGAAGWGGVFRDGWQLALALAAYRPRAVAVSLLLLLASSATEAFGILMLLPILNTVAAGGAAEPQGLVAGITAGAAAAVGLELTLTSALAAFVGIIIVRSLIVWQRDVLLPRIRLGFVDDLRARLHETMAAARWQFLAGQRQSDFHHVLTGEMPRIGQASLYFLHIAVAAALLAAQMAVAFLISPAVSAAALAAGAVLFLLTKPLVRRSRVSGTQAVSTNRAVFSHVLDFLAGLKFAKSQARERSHVNRFVESLAEARRRQLESAAATAMSQMMLGLGGALVLAVVAWFAIAQAGLTLPELAVGVLVFARIMTALTSLQKNTQMFAHTAPSYNHARMMLRQLRQETECAAGDAELLAGPTPRMPLETGLTVREVSYSYDPGGYAGGESGKAPPPALRGVSLHIPAGEITAITGPSGAGKSTLADLMLGLLEPAAGAVLVDGVALTAANRRRWRRSCAYVPQDPYLFNDTIRANVRGARPDASDADVWRALDMAAADFVATLPQGLDTMAGDRGGRLSGGERQRIALAGALLAEPTLLLLDEATSQLDAQTEQRIVESLLSLRGRMTIVVVAHREALLAAADRVVTLDAGRVAGGESRIFSATAAGQRRPAAGES